MMNIVAVWILKPVVIVLQLIHLNSAYVQDWRDTMGCNPAVPWAIIFRACSPFILQPTSSCGFPAGPRRYYQCIACARSACP